MKKFHDVFQGVIENPGFVDYVEKMGMEVSYRNAEDSMEFLLRSRENFSHLMKLLNIPRESDSK